MGKNQVIAILALSYLVVIQHVTADAPEGTTGKPSFSNVVCSRGQPGPQGWPGEMGQIGMKGDKGDRGEHSYSQFRPPVGTPCYCPEGPKGEKGDFGEPGYIGDTGVEGASGIPEEKGNKGLPGPPGLPASSSPLNQPPESPGILYVPVIIKGKMPRVVCHYMKRHAYVPVVSNKFVGWHEPGKSSYLTYNKWLYWSSSFTCRCSVHLPPGPTPSPEELLRRLKRK